MAVAPAGAQISEDGHYWWDEQNQQWQLNDETPAGGQDASATASSPDEAAQYTGSVEAQVALYGQCVNVEFSETEIDDLLAQAGASLDQA